ncbi:NADH-flavin reductase [Bacillus cereus]|uniref:SDR family oxidoreductase n=1 Tax=Bacillus TaxID=1386 RepID=UPI00089C0E6F|nr:MULTISPECIES: SDR family oxidoreductase [Bacillus]PFD96112.1 NADH-flavin reductase [Bacillus sp. AFS023182]PGX97311.1 NADH-flavin reductase [Bacillus cereus]WIY63391.1 SDR family oxidoreductase [Bacillus arachidis]SDY83623.1 Putative NADH-flavin reductase [Bacillus sp. 166amftsu]
MKIINKVAIIGANGKAGKYLITQALLEGYFVRILTRDPQKFKISHKHLEVVKGDARDISAIRRLLQGCNAVINAVGQPKKESYIFSTVTNHILEVMKEYGIKRYILISGGSMDVQEDTKSLLNKIGAKLFRLFLSSMMKDKYKELQLVRDSNVNWTIVRLPFVVDGEGTGKIKESLIDLPGIKIQNGDIAPFVIKQIQDEMYSWKCPFISN